MRSERKQTITLQQTNDLVYNQRKLPNNFEETLFCIFLELSLVVKKLIGIDLPSKVRPYQLFSEFLLMQVQL